VVDPTSVAAVMSVLSAVSGGIAGEAGKWAWGSAGSLARRIAGHEVPAPAGAAEREELSRLLAEAARRSPAQAEAVSQWMQAAPQPPAGSPVASRFPVSTRFFTDRQNAMKQLDREAARKSDGRPRVALLHGPEGIGTSALAVHWGCREVERFPDGQLYADLRGDSAEGALTAAAVLGAFLRQLGVPADEIPPPVEERSALFRALVADRRLLVVLDHAHSAAQVRPLLSSAPAVLTIVVSSRAVLGLDAVRIPVGPLADKDAVRLLTDLAGKQAVAAARAVLPSVLARCGGSPFALRAAAPRLSVFSRAEGFPGAAPAGTGADPGGDPVGSATEALYRQLDPELARGYRQLSVWPWPFLDAAAAAAALGAEPDRAGWILAELAEQQLLEQLEDGRYRYRPAVRRHAARAAAAEDGIAASSATVHRTVEHCLRLAVRADYAALPGRWHLGPRYAESVPAPSADPGAALALLTAELANLVEAVRAAEEFGRLSMVWQLCEALWALQLKAGHHTELLPALRSGVRAAEALHPGSRISGRMHTQLSFALVELQQYDEAEVELAAAAAAELEAGHVRGRATAVESLGLLRLRQWRYQEAADLFETSAALLDAIGPGEEGAADLPRARALLLRHRGRALRGLGRLDRARELLGSALRAFEELDGPDEPGDRYNAARTLTDLADTFLDEGERAAALPLIDRAIGILAKEGAELHLVHLRRLRAQCLTTAG